LRPKA